MKYSDFNFYVATTKNNKIDFGPYIELIHYIAIQLSESLKLLRKMFIIVKQNFLDLWNFPKHLVGENRRGYLIFWSICGSWKKSHKVLLSSRDPYTDTGNRGTGNGVSVGFTNLCGHWSDTKTNRKSQKIKSFYLT